MKAGNSKDGGRVVVIARVAEAGGRRSLLSCSASLMRCGSWCMAFIKASLSCGSPQRSIEHSIEPHGSQRRVDQPVEHRMSGKMRALWCPGQQQTGSRTTGGEDLLEKVRWAWRTWWHAPVAPRFRRFIDKSHNMRQRSKSTGRLLFGNRTSQASHVWWCWERGGPLCICRPSRCRIHQTRDVHRG